MHGISPDRPGVQRGDDMIVYADFSSPYSYLASHRVDALSAAGVEVDWRAVEGDPHLPVGGERLGAAEQDELSVQFAELARQLLPGERLPWQMPTSLPKTEAAVSGYAEASGAGVADDVRRLLFAMYWTERADIGDPNVLRTPLAGPILRGTSTSDPLRQAGYAVSVGRGPITTDAYRRIRSWQREWQQLGLQRLPALVDGAVTLTGMDALRRLGKELTYIDAAPQPALQNPRHYPELSVHPSAAWASQTGQRWSYTRRSISPGR